MGKKTWTEEQEKILTEMISDNKSFKEISEIINKTTGQISDKKNKMHLSYPIMRSNNYKFKAIYQDYDWFYQKFITENMTYEEMAKEADCSKRVIKKWGNEKFKLTDHSRKTFLTLNEKQIDLVIGSILGDGHIDKRPKYSIFIVSHAENQKEYLYWKYELMENLCNSKPFYKDPHLQKFPNGKEYLCQGSYMFRTRSIDELRQYQQLSIYERIERLNKFSLSVFFLDDGHRSDNAWQICVAMFNDKDKELFKNILYNNFDINITLSNSDNRYFNLNVENSKKIDKMILNNIPNELDVVQYKIIKPKG